MIFSLNSACLLIFQLCKPKSLDSLLSFFPCIPLICRSSYYYLQNVAEIHLPLSIPCVAQVQASTLSHQNCYRNFQSVPPAVSQVPSAQFLLHRLTRGICLKAPIPPYHPPLENLLASMTLRIPSTFFAKSQDSMSSVSC